jgi:hypothetical protein
MYVEAPKNREFRRTIYPRLTPADHPLAERLAARLSKRRVPSGRLGRTRSG